MARWLLIPIKESGSGFGPIALLIALFVGAILFGLTGELIQVQVLGNKTPIAERGVGTSFLIGGIVWLIIAAIIFAVRKIRK